MGTLSGGTHRDVGWRCGGDALVCSLVKAWVRVREADVPSLGWAWGHGGGRGDTGGTWGHWGGTGRGCGTWDFGGKWGHKGQGDVGGCEGHGGRGVTWGEDTRGHGTWHWGYRVTWGHVRTWRGTHKNTEWGHWQAGGWDRGHPGHVSPHHLHPPRPM